MQVLWKPVLRVSKEYVCSYQDHVLVWGGGPGSALLVAEAMLDTPRSYPALQSLNMLTQTHGKERTGGEYAQLLRQHGFGDVRIAHTWNFLDVVLAIKN